MALCDVSGILYKSAGLTASTEAPLTGFEFSVADAELEGEILGQAGVKITTHATTGAFSFTVKQGALITVRGNFTLGGYNFKGGVRLFVPFQSSIDFEALMTPEDYCQALGAAALYAPASAKFIIQTANATLSNAQVLGSLATGIVKNTTTTGVLSIAAAADMPTPTTLTELVSPDGAADFAQIWDTSASAWKKVLLDNLPGGGGGGGAVSSVFGRTGAVVAATNDYTWAQIDKTTSSLADITTRSASDLSSGTLPDGRFPATLPAASGVNLTALNASNLGSGTIPDARFPATLPALNGSNLTSLNASNLASGTVPSARGGAGTVNGLMKANGSGVVSAAVAGTDYENPLTFSTGLSRSTNTVSVDTSVIATKAYADSLVVGLLDDRGNYDASGNVFPSSGGSGSAGAVLKGDIWTISVAGTLGGTPVTAGDMVRALVDTPGQTAGNWAVSETNIGYTALNAALNDGQVYIGNSSNVGTARTFSGDVTVNNTGVTAIGAGKVTNAMLAGSIDLTSKVTGTLPVANGGTGITALGTGVATALGVNIGSAGAFVTFNGAGGTPSSLTLTNATGLPPTTGISGWPANSSGVLTNNGSGTLSWAAAGGSPGGSNTQLQYNNSSAFGGISGATSDGTNVTYGSGNLRATSPQITTGIADSSGNSLIAVTATGSAIYGLTLANAASGGTVAVGVTTPTQAASGIAGTPLSITASNAVAGASNAGAVAGGSVTITAGNAARLTSGNANGGNINLITGTGIGTGTAGQILGPDGTSALPAYSFTSKPGSGMSIYGNNLQFSANGSLNWTVAGTDAYTNTNGQLRGGLTLGVVSTGQIGFGSTAAILSTLDVIMRRSAAANLAFGAADAASPVAQTESNQNVVGGTTNGNGAQKTYIASLGTSQGVPGRQHFQGGAMIAASGTTQQTAIDRAIFNATKVLTNNSATTITNVTAASGSSAGGQLGYYVEVTDGTDYQYEVGVVSFGVTNKAGAFSGNTATKFGNHQNATSGTLSVTFAISGANPAVLSCNANSSLTPSTGYPRIVYWMMNGGNQAVSIQ